MLNCLINGLFLPPPISVPVWDTAVQERFRSTVPMYYRNTNAALLVFDITHYTVTSIKSRVKDFGFAQFLSDEAYHNSLRGSPLYMAPEMLIKRHYDAKVDLWSVGVIAYECLFGHAPYSSANIKQLHNKILAQTPIEIPEGCVSADCADLLRRLLQHDPQQRLSYDQLFDHPFLDLEHLPSEESYKKAVGLVHDAVKQDAAKEFKQAFMLYCQALQYFVPYIEAEKDLVKKDALSKKVAEYTKRAEELKTVLHPPNMSKGPSQTKHAAETKISATNITEVDGKPPSAQPTLSPKLFSSDLQLQRLEPQRKVPKEEALQCTQSIGGTYFEVSALLDQGIK